MAGTSVFTMLSMSEPHDAKFFEDFVDKRPFLLEGASRRAVADITKVSKSNLEKSFEVHATLIYMGKKTEPEVILRAFREEIEESGSPIPKTLRAANIIKWPRHIVLELDTPHLEEIRAFLARVYKRLGDTPPEGSVDPASRPWRPHFTLVDYGENEEACTKAFEQLKANGDLDFCAGWKFNLTQDIDVVWKRDGLSRSLSLHLANMSSRKRKRAASPDPKPNKS